MAGTIFAVEPDFYKYRQLVNESNWKASQPLLWGKHIDGALEIRLRYRTLAEDQKEERIDRRLGENRPKTRAVERHRSKPGDCANALNLSNTLLLSAKARLGSGKAIDRIRVHSRRFGRIKLHATNDQEFN